MRRAARPWALAAAVVTALAAGSAAAEMTVEVTPRSARPGDAVLVTVKGVSRTAATSDAVAAHLEDRPIQLWPIRGGVQGVAALPTAPAELGELAVKVAAGDTEVRKTITVRPRELDEVELAVEEIFVDPPPDVRRVIEDDRAAIAQAYTGGAELPVVRRPFAWPRARVITARFGQHRMFNGTLNSRHEGTDLAGKPGDLVRAANHGTVVLSRELFYSGRTVLIDHGAGIYTGYFHLSVANVAEGDVIERGRPIGEVGATGRVTGPHLHYAVRVGGQYVDPESFMRLPLKPPYVEIERPRAAARVP